MLPAGISLSPPPTSIASVGSVFPLTLLAQSSFPEGHVQKSLAADYVQGILVVSNRHTNFDPVIYPHVTQKPAGSCFKAVSLCAFAPLRTTFISLPITTVGTCPYWPVFPIPFTQLKPYLRRGLGQVECGPVGHQSLGQHNKDSTAGAWQTPMSMAGKWVLSPPRLCTAVSWVQTWRGLAWICPAAIQGGCKGFGSVRIIINLELTQGRTTCREKSLLQVQVCLAWSSCLFLQCSLLCSSPFLFHPT